MTHPDDERPVGCPAEPTGQEPTGPEPTGPEPTGQEPAGLEPVQDADAVEREPVDREPVERDVGEAPAGEPEHPSARPADDLPMAQTPGVTGPATERLPEGPGDRATGTAVPSVPVDQPPAAVPEVGTQLLPTGAADPALSAEPPRDLEADRRPDPAAAQMAPIDQPPYTPTPESTRGAADLTAQPAAEPAAAQAPAADTTVLAAAGPSDETTQLATQPAAAPGTAEPGTAEPGTVGPEAESTAQFTASGAPSGSKPAAGDCATGSASEAFERPGTAPEPAAAPAPPVGTDVPMFVVPAAVAPMPIVAPPATSGADEKPAAATPSSADDEALGYKAGYAESDAAVAATGESTGESTDESTGESTDESTDDGSGSGAFVAGRRSLVGGLLSVVAIALLTVLVALSAYLGWQLRRDDQAATARTQGLLAARDAARLLFSYDYKQLDKDFAAGLAVTTGPFHDEYQRTTTTVVKPVAEQYQAVVKADVREASVVQAAPGQVVTLVFVNQTTTSTRVTGPRVDQSRVRMQLKLVNGTWLVDRVDAL